MASVECLIGEMTARILDEVQVAGGDKPPLTARPAGGHRKPTRRLAMAYGLSTRAFIADGPAGQVATAPSWRALDETRPLALVAQAVRAVNDAIDAFPLAL